MNEWSDVIWIIVGFGFGCIFMLNHRSYKDAKTLEQVDETIRDELALKTNLVNSLKQDLAYAKQKLEALKKQQ